MASEYTPNYNLDLYVSTDKPNLRDQYNAAMGKVDAQMKKNADDIVNANANVGTLQLQMTTANENIGTLQTQMATANENIGTLQTNVETVQTDVSTLKSTVETQGTQITAVQSTAGDALSLAQTNVDDIANLDGEVEQLQEFTANMTNLNQTVTVPSTYFTTSNVYQGTAPSDMTAVGDVESVNGSITFYASQNSKTIRVFGALTINTPDTFEPTGNRLAVKVPLSVLGGVGQLMKNRYINRIGTAMLRQPQSSPAGSMSFVSTYCGINCDETDAYFYVAVEPGTATTFMNGQFLQIPVFLESEPFPNAN